MWLGTKEEWRRKRVERRETEQGYKKKSENDKRKICVYKKQTEE